MYLHILVGLRWNISVLGKVVPESNCIVHSLQPEVHNISDLLKMLHVLSKATVCPGNAEESMGEVVKSRGGTVRNVCGLTILHTST